MREHLVKNGPTLPQGHQTWQMNEINKLMWPNTGGIGVMNQGRYKRTAAIAKQFKVIKKAPTRRVPHRPRREGGRAAEEAGRGRRTVRATSRSTVKLTPGGK